MGRILVWVAVALWLVSYFGSGSAPPVSPPSGPSPTVRTLLEILGLLKHVSLISEANASATIPPNELSKQPVTFKPAEFVAKHNIKTKDDTARLRKKLETIVVMCTEEVIRSGERNAILRFERRAACMEKRGLDKIDAAFVGAFR